MGAKLDQTTGECVFNRKIAWSMMGVATAFLGGCGDASEVEPPEFVVEPGPPAHSIVNDLPSSFLVGEHELVPATAKPRSEAEIPAPPSQSAPAPPASVFGGLRGFPAAWSALIAAARVTSPFGYHCVLDYADDLRELHDDLLDEGEPRDSPRIEALEKLIDAVEDYGDSHIGCGYVSASVGFGSLTTNHLTSPTFSQNPQTDFGNAVYLGLGAGVELRPGIYFGLDYTLHNDIGVKFSSSGLSGTSSAQSNTFMLDTVVVPAEIFRPLRSFTEFPLGSAGARADIYTWAGLGFSVNSLNETAVSIGGNNQNCQSCQGNASAIRGGTTTSFAGGIGMGLRFHGLLGSPNVNFDLGYRSDWLGQFETGNKATSNGTAATIAPTKVDVRTDNFFVRAVYMF